MNSVFSGSSIGGIDLSATAAKAPMSSSISAANSILSSEPATDIKYCAIDNPDCEACQ